MLLHVSLPWTATSPSVSGHLLSLPSTSTSSVVLRPRRSFSFPLLLRQRHGHLSSPTSSSTSYVHSGKSEIDGFQEELRRLLAVLPDTMRSSLASHPDLLHLVEVVMDLGRNPIARFPAGEFVLSPRPITFDDLRHVTSKVGEFAADNRAGISRTLHRISGIRNRSGAIVGLTCRVGRAVGGSADSLRDLVRDGGSLLLIGPPGVGKTTIIREIARMLADDYKKRVMIVDTSNEIGGDGDVPHPGIGNARRMQVPNFDMQHKVLIEAVENHMPQAIIIDEIGTELEAMAASTIAQRGIQLVASAHGVTIENLTMNPSLEMLVGGIQSVTLGDEEASRRGGQKTILERKGPSTFTCAVEMMSKTELCIHHNLEATVDALLSGRSPTVKKCKITSDGFKSEAPSDITNYQLSNLRSEEKFVTSSEPVIVNNYTCENIERTPVFVGNHAPIRLYVYGITETSVEQAIKQMKMDSMIQMTDNINESDAFLALRAKLKKNSQIHSVAKAHQLPVFVAKTCSLEQITKALHALVSTQTNGIEDALVHDEMPSPEKADALEEARLAIEQVVIPKGQYVELLPRPSHIVSAQMDLARRYNLDSMKVGREPDVYIRILPFNKAADNKIPVNMDDAILEHQDYDGPDGLNNFHNGVGRLPLLSD